MIVHGVMWLSGDGKQEPTMDKEALTSRSKGQDASISLLSSVAYQGGL